MTWLTTSSNKGNEAGFTIIVPTDFFVNNQIYLPKNTYIGDKYGTVHVRDQQNYEWIGILSLITGNKIITSERPIYLSIYLSIYLYIYLPSR